MTNPLLEANPLQTTSRSGLSQTGFKPLWLNAHSRLDSVNANQCALNRIECALSVQCERAFRLSFTYGVISLFSFRCLQALLHVWSDQSVQLQVPSGSPSRME